MTKKLSFITGIGLVLLGGSYLGIELRTASFRVGFPLVGLLAALAPDRNGYRAAFLYAPLPGSREARLGSPLHPRLAGPGDQRDPVFLQYFQSLGGLVLLMAP